MATTFKIEIQKPNKDGERKIMVVVNHNGERKRLDTNIVGVKRDFSKGGELRNYDIIDQVNDYVRELRTRANKIASRIAYVDIETLLEYLREYDKHIDFMLVFREYIEENNDSGGIRNYRSAYNSFARFIGKESIDVLEVTSSLLSRYCATMKGRRCASLYLGAIRHVHQWACFRYNNEEIGVVRIPFNPFTRVMVPKQGASRKRAIEADVIKRIMELPYRPAKSKNGRRCIFNLAKDCFILSFGLIGMNSADLYDAKDYSSGRITYFRAKTRDRRADNAEISVNVQAPISELFNKYRDKSGKRVFCFYKMYSSASNFNKAINKGLKEVGEELGLDGLQFYAARHSWATIARNDLRIDKFTIHEALNHVDKDMSITDIYIKKDFSNINEANKIVLEYIFNSLD